MLIFNSKVCLKRIVNVTDKLGLGRGKGLILYPHQYGVCLYPRLQGNKAEILKAYAQVQAQSGAYALFHQKYPIHNQIKGCGDFQLRKGGTKSAGQFLPHRFPASHEQGNMSAQLCCFAPGARPEGLTWRNANNGYWLWKRITRTNWCL